MGARDPGLAPGRPAIVPQRVHPAPRSASQSLFITELAYGTEPSAHFARIGVLLGSVVAGAAGHLVLTRTLPPTGAGEEP